MPADNLYQKPAKNYKTRKNPAIYNIQYGFSLVELSIVLVAIGLIIGGILTGQTLIESSRINRTVSDLSQYNIAITHFREKYKTLPGDSPSFTPAGNANGILDTSSASSHCDNESFQAFSHLSQSRMLNRTYAPTPTSDCDQRDFMRAIDKKYAPYSETSAPPHSNYLGTEQTKWYMALARTTLESDAYIYFFAKANHVPSLFRKIGEIPEHNFVIDFSIYSKSAIGQQLWSASAQGRNDFAHDFTTATNYCQAADGSEILCMDDLAVYAELYYFIPE